MNAGDTENLPSNFALWTVVLGPPLLWFTQFQARYAVIPWSCANGNRFWLWSLSIAAIALALVRAHFMSLVGAMSAALFLLVILAQALPVFLIDPCIQ